MSSFSKIIVSKFGGSSMADAVAMKRSAEIVKKQNSAVVVVSATYGTTNLLVAAAEKADKGKSEQLEPIFKEIRENHNKIAADLNADAFLLEELKKIYKEMDTVARQIAAVRQAEGENVEEAEDIDPDLIDPEKQPKRSLEPDEKLSTGEIPRLKDTFFGLGERMSSLLFTRCLQIIGVPASTFDVAKVMRTDDRFSRAVPVFDAIEPLAQKYLYPLISGDNAKTIVTQGFIGATESGVRTTLGRGGSDYSAAILAWALNAAELEIWTDVGGVATTDPRITPNTKPIRELSFQEAAELATFGAKILHPSTLIPAIWKEIPVYVGSSIHPDDGGTRIYRTVGEAPLIRALTIRRNQSLLTITTPDMLNTYGFLYRVFKLFNDYKVSVDSITTSEISVAMTVDDVTLNNTELLEALGKLGQLQIEKSFDQVSIIGNNINHTAGLAQKVFQELSDINVRMIGQGASKHNFCLLVDEGNGEEALKRLHKILIEKEVQL
ncbi:aspartate kinase [Balneolaceae bacterium ANBcel3]|nr:aspartate kinase [Balneolaceae bacterium ANBcel3]